MKLVIDMNLSPVWCTFFEQEGYKSVHWTSVGDIRATDRTITAWAKENGYVVFTHDLDFGTILAVTNADSPSVLQVREHDVLPDTMGTIVLEALRKFEDFLAAGALITVDSLSMRARILPMRK